MDLKYEDYFHKRITFELNRDLYFFNMRTAMKIRYVG